MRSILLSLALSAGLNTFAAVGDIHCTAKQFEITRDGLANQIEIPLKVVSKNGSALNLSGDIGQRAFVLSGDTHSGDFLLTQAWGDDYTTGINTAGSFNSSGRMTLSLVEVNKVFKLECTKTLASEFPRE